MNAAIQRCYYEHTDVLVTRAETQKGRIRMWRQTSFSLRIIVHMSLIIMLTFIGAGYMSYRINVKTFAEEISKQFNKANEQAAARIDLQLRDIYRISNFVVFHPYIEQVVRRSAESEEREQHTRISDQDELNTLLYQVKNDENKLYSMFLYDMKDNSLFFHVSPSAESILDKAVYADVKERLEGSSGNLVWFPVRLGSKADASSYRNFFVAARYMKNKDLEQYGTMVMLFDESLFSEDLNELVSDEKANVFLFDRQDRLIYTDRRDDDPQHIPVPDQLVQQQILHEESGSYLYVKSRSRLTDYSLVSRVSLDALQEKSSVIFKISGLVAVIGVILAGILISWSGRRLFKPLGQLVQGMRRMREGDMATRVKVDTNDELAYIGQSFNSMAEDLERLIREVYERQLNEREAELTALQTQLNPHFLHNTLDTIYWKLYLQDDRDTARLVVSLSDMLRYALEPADTETTLLEEVAQIRNYLTIQSTRYGEELEALIQLEPGTEQAHIPRLLLQPLVENVFVHAFADKLSDRVLIIRTVRTSLDGGKGLLIEIMDNGKGMDKEEIQRILALAAAPRSERMSAEGPVVGRKRIHIGIRSVVRRLSLLYGKPYGISLESKPEAGTTVRLLLPMERNGADEG